MVLVYPQKPLRHAPSQSGDRLRRSRCPKMTQFREGSQSRGLREPALPPPPLLRPRRLDSPRFPLVADPWRRRGSLGKITRRSLAADSVVGGCCDSQGEVATSSCQHGMSSYAPCTTRDKPTDWRYLCYQGRSRDPRISPGRLLAKRERSPRRPNSGLTPNGAQQPDGLEKGHQRRHDCTRGAKTECLIEGRPRR